MPRKLMRACFWLVIGLGACAGCGGVSTSPKNAAATGPKTYDRSKLPKTAQELPALDQGRVEVPTPTGWQWRSQEKNILTRFNLAKQAGLPQIVVKIDSEFSPTITDVTPDNVSEYANSLQHHVDSKGTKLLEPVRPLILGDSAWARYVMSGKLPDKQIATLERQLLKTTRGGRTYLIELQVNGNELATYRDAAYAIAADMKFSSRQTEDANSKPESPAAAEPAPDAAPAPPPADSPAPKPESM